MQIANQIEDSIFMGIFEEEAQVPSTTELSALLNINPHTVLKGMNLLVSQGIIYKKRGLGMFVSTGSLEKIKGKRADEFAKKYISPLVLEAEKLGLSKEDIIKQIERVFINE